jgi:transcription antitermination factor NusG
MRSLHWYALYTKPRWEKKIAKTLTEKGFEVYCPLTKVVRQWSDRKKIVEEPLFKGYIFTRIKPEERTAIRMTEGVVNFVYWNGKPALVRDDEIQTIKRFLGEFSNVEVEDLNLKVNTAVIVKKGLLMNYHGIVLEVIGNKAKVLIESMGVRLSATIDKKNLELLSPG